MRWTRNFVAIALLGLVSACSLGETEIASCPNVAIVKGLERAELTLSRDGIESTLDIRFGQIDGTCEFGDQDVVLAYDFDIVVENNSPFNVNDLSVDYFIAVTLGGQIIDKSGFTSPTMDVAAASDQATRERIEQRFELAPGKNPWDYDILIGFDLPQDIGLRQRSGF